MATLRVSSYLHMHLLDQAVNSENVTNALAYFGKNLSIGLRLFPIEKEIVRTHIFCCLNKVIKHFFL